MRTTGLVCIHRHIARTQMHLGTVVLAFAVGLHCIHDAQGFTGGICERLKRHVSVAAIFAQSRNGSANI